MLKKLGLNLSLQLIIKFLAIFLGLFIVRWLVSNLSEAQYAGYNIILSYVNVILSIISLGIPLVVQKFYTNSHDTNQVGDFWLTFSFLRLISYFVGISFIFLLYYLKFIQNFSLAFLVFSVMFLLVADLSYRSICDAKGRSWQFSVTDFGSKVLIFSLLLLAYKLKPENIDYLNYYLLVGGFANLACLLADAFWQKSETPFGRVRFQILKDNARPLLYLTLSAVLIALYVTTDKLFLDYFGYSDQEIGSYANAYKIFETILVVPGITMPTLASLVKRRLDQEKLTQLGEKIFNRLESSKRHFSKRVIIIFEWLLLTFFIGIITSLGSFIVSPLIFRFIDPTSKYVSSPAILAILIVAITSTFVIYLVAHLIIFMHGEKYELIGTFCTMVVALSLYGILISKFGAIGAAWATLITYIFDMCLKIFFFTKVFEKSKHT